ncbi:ABC transporter substrate-binding protein [Brenneria populi subsp. brevivirga]|uniref:ABC transporter substrate-binding protein n=1 Tax=Brenneria populi TaxID=1505588 RepID=UPI002E179F89|nr:ABC transporter substrate-binding protein [Brenneria populi subsp. brevivirga]
MTLKKSLLASLLGTTLAFAALHSAPVLAGKADDTLNVAFSDEPEPLDSYKIAGRQGLIIARHIYDGLLYKDLSSGEIKPALAQSWKFTDDKTIEFALRKGVKFHNGADFNADDVITTLNTVIKPAYGTRFQISVDWIASVEKVDDYTVRIHMAKPFAGAVEMLADALPIYPHAYFAEKGSAGMAEHPVGTGPYKLVEQTPGVRYVLERFDQYYAGSPKGKPAIKRIVIRTIPEMNTQYAELMSGKLDWIWRVPPDQAKRLAGRVNMINAPIMRIAYVSLAAGSATDTPIANPLVRKAMLYAVNRQQIAKVFGGASSQVLNSACNPLQFGCEQDVAAYGYDPQKAKALLKEAGYPNGFDLEMVFSAIPRPVAEAVSSDLAKVGVRVRLNENQFAAAVQKWRAGTLPALMSNWGSYGIGDVAFILSNYFGGGDDDMVKDAQLAAWLKVADASPDNEVRKQNYSLALKKIADQAYWIPLYNYNINYGLSKDLNFTPQPDEFARWWLSSWK